MPFSDAFGQQIWIASELQKENPTWNDEQLFQEARKLNIAEYQSIIYNEWIPDVLGPTALAAYNHNPGINVRCQQVLHGGVR